MFLKNVIFLILQTTLIKKFMLTLLKWVPEFYYLLLLNS
jgi:hypothetical protein